MGARIVIVMLCLFVSAATCTTPDRVGRDTERYAPIASTLTSMNQRVAAEYLLTGIPDDFDAVQYRAALDRTCYTSTCTEEVQALFSSFLVRVHKVGGMFSVLVCDRNGTRKILEDFSCNNNAVELPSWKVDPDAACVFAPDWEQVIKPYCP
jgi:hypothetical protein